MRNTSTCSASSSQRKKRAMNSHHWFDCFIIGLISTNLAGCNNTKIFADFNTVQQLNAYFERFFARNNTISTEEWFNALPKPKERTEMKKLINNILWMKEFATHCTHTLLVEYPELQQSINITLFKNKFCVIHELIPPTNNGLFKRYWGYVVISDRFARNLHHSAAHFQSDGDVCNETAAIFERTAGRSLVIAGASRFAVIGNETNRCQPKTALADAAHNNETMFQTYNEAIYEAVTNSKSQNDNTFIQWHGMAETSCHKVKVFVSVGANNATSVYRNKNLTANRIVRQLNELKAGTAWTPGSTSECNLIARTNIFGRYINGVPIEDVCRQNANNANIHGSFVHIEQKRAMRDDWDSWTKVLNAVFPFETNRSSSHKSFLAFLNYILLTSIFVVYHE